MKNISLSRLAFGVGIIGVGVAALLGSFDIINFGELVRNYWPLLLIAGGLVLLADDLRQNYIWAGILIILGVVAELNVLALVEVNFWQIFWPIVLILFGSSLLFKRAGVSTNSDDKVTAIFAGAETRNSSKDYRGGQVTAILGGSSINLSKAVIKKEATLEILAVMGGVELRVPDEWEVRTSVMPILGGVENKAQAPKGNNAPVLNIVGTVLMGGIEIKN